MVCHTWASVVCLKPIQEMVVMNITGLPGPVQVQHLERLARLKFNLVLTHVTIYINVSLYANNYPLSSCRHH